MTEPFGSNPEAAGGWVRYLEYKDSGVAWLGEIPAHWEVRRLGKIGPVAKCSGGPKSDEASDGVPCIRYGDLYTQYDSFITRSRALVSRERAPRYSTTRYGDLLFAASGETIEEIGRAAVNLMDSDTLCGGDIVLLRPGIEVSPRFLGYTGNAPYMALQKSRVSRGMTVMHIYGNQLKRLLVVLPPVAEQRAIAHFLDREAAKTDALVAKQQELIRLLQEKRAALINHAVTKGLDPDTAMKDSGVEWLGEIPAHWEVKRVKWAARMESGHTPDKKVDAYWNDGDVPWVSLSDTGYLKDHDYISDTEYYTNELGLSNSSARLLPPRSVIFSRDATIGLCAITERPMAVSQHFIAWICHETLLPEYLLRVFDTMQEELVRLTMGATLRTIGMPDVKTLSMPVPAVAEQDRIVAFVRKETVAIDALIAKTRQAIAHLNEYRTALVSAAVTGQIDVRSLLQTTTSPNPPTPHHIP